MFSLKNNDFTDNNGFILILGDGTLYVEIFWFIDI